MSPRASSSVAAPSASPAAIAHALEAGGGARKVLELLRRDRRRFPERRLRVGDGDALRLELVGLVELGEREPIGLPHRRPGATGPHAGSAGMGRVRKALLA